MGSFGNIMGMGGGNHLDAAMSRRGMQGAGQMNQQTSGSASFNPQTMGAPQAPQMPTPMGTMQTPPPQGMGQAAPAAQQPPPGMPPQLGADSDKTLITKALIAWGNHYRDIEKAQMGIQK